MSDLELLKLVTFVLALAIAIIGHEIMHGWVAYKYGDTTAKNSGRLSINPIVHIDPIGTIIIPIILYGSGAPFLFGWAKPVPVHIPTVLHNGGTNGAIAVSLAGVVFNFLLALFFATLLPIFLNPNSIFDTFIALFLYQGVVINVLLGVFNLWPIPPLDGANVVRFFALGLNMTRFVAYYEKLYPYGMLLLVAILFTPLSNYLFAPVHFIVQWLIIQ